MAVEKNLYSGESTSVLYLDRRDFYINPNVVKELWTDPAPLTTIISNVNQKTGLKDPLFKMFEHRNYWVDQRFQLDATENSELDPTSNSEVTLTLPTASATNFIGLGTAATKALVGLECAIHANTSGKATGERKAVVIITSFTSATEIKVKCISTSDGSAYTIADAPWLVVIGNAHGEGSKSPEAWADELSVVYGSCQIFRTPVKVTNTLKQAVLRGETKELERLRLLKGQEHKVQKERAFLFGSNVPGTGMGASETFGDTGRTDANGELIRTTTGIFEAILKYGATSGDNQSIFSIAEATYTYSNFVDDMEKVFQYFPENGTKIMLASAKMMSYWSKMEGSGGSGIAGKSKWTVKLSDTMRDKMGFNFRILETPHGIIQLVPAPAITRSPYNGYGVIIDKENLFHALYENPKYCQNIETDNNPQFQKDEYFSYEGIGINLIETHKLFKLA